MQLYEEANNENDHEPINNAYVVEKRDEIVSSKQKCGFVFVQFGSF